MPLFHSQTQLHMIINLINCCRTDSADPVAYSIVKHTIFVASNFGTLKTGRNRYAKERGRLAHGLSFNKFALL